MLLRLIKNNMIQGIIFIILLMVLLWLGPLFQPHLHGQVGYMPLYDILFGKIEKIKVLSVLSGILFYVLMIIFVIRLNVVHFLLEDRSNMPAVFFLLITASSPHSMLVNPVLISSVFLLLALLVMIKGVEHRADPMAIFNASLLLAAGSLFYMKILWFIPFLWITAAVIRPLKWRGLFNPFLVTGMLVLFYITYYWVFRNDLSMFPELLSGQLVPSPGEFTKPGRARLVLYGYMLLLILLSSIYLISRFQARKIIIRKLYQVFFLMFVYVLLFFFFISGYDNDVIILAAIPLSYLFSSFFFRKKNRRIHELLIWIWLVLVAWVQVEPLLGP